MIWYIYIQRLQPFSNTLYHDTKDETLICCFKSRLVVVFQDFDFDRREETLLPPETTVQFEIWVFFVDKDVYRHHIKQTFVIVSPSIIEDRGFLIHF